jgi:predicted nuclease of predicted toxin-antitoxin system
MKLLFDENLSPKLTRLAADLFPESQHIRDAGLTGLGDDNIWIYAKTNGFTIISMDKDFYQRALLYGAPPKFIWLRLGNCTRDDLLALIQGHERDISAFETSPESVLILS